MSSPPLRLRNKDLINALGTDGETIQDSSAAASVLSPIGANNANNAFSSASVVSNADGSMLERQEYIQSALNTSTSLQGGVPTYFFPGLGYQVIKVGDIASAPDDLFTVTGDVLITRMVGKVTSVFATTTSLRLYTSTAGAILVASSTVTTLAAGMLAIVTGDPDDALNGAYAFNADAAMSKTNVNMPIYMADDKIYQGVNGAGTGTIQWTLFYIPLTAASSVASSA